jgi:hypothetical protein
MPDKPFTVDYDKMNWYAHHLGRKYQFRTLAQATSFLGHADNYSRGLLAQFTSFDLTSEERERFGNPEPDPRPLVAADRPEPTSYREAMIDAGRGHLLRGDE